MLIPRPLVLAFLLACGASTRVLRAVPRGGLGAARVRMQQPPASSPSGWAHRNLRLAIPRKATAAAAAPSAPPALGLETPLLEHPRVLRGELRNGLRYAILPNPTPIGRFEAHLELHVGSCEEADDEQGLAHLVEHVTFMGSRKRERLFSTGSKSNAYTDFHHTVYHFHCPLTDTTGRALMPLALDALREIAFEPELLGARIEKERKAILSELQMINTIDYRCSTMHLRELHADNPLAHRFPIGREEQIARWDATHVRAFHRTHYQPDAADLYIVGDVDAAAAERLVADVFRSVAPRPRSLAALRRAERRSKPQVSHEWTLATREQRAGAGAGSEGGTGAQAARGRALLGGIGAAAAPAARAAAAAAVASANAAAAGGGDGARARGVTIFKHELLQSFSLTLFAKEPVLTRTRVSDLASFLTDRIVACCVARRLNSRERPNPPFTGSEFDFSDAPSEGCVVSTFIIYADASEGRWQRAVQRALGELRLLEARGLSAAEVAAMHRAILADSKMRAQQLAAPSVDSLALLMESDALGHVFAEPSHYDTALHAAADAVDLARVNARMRELIAHITRYGEADAPRAAAVVLCMPAEGCDGVTDDPVLAAELEAMLRARAPLEADASEVSTPLALVDAETLARRRSAHAPRWVGVAGAAGAAAPPPHLGLCALAPVPAGAEPGEVRLRRLSNGVAVNSVRSTAEPDALVLRLCAPGGRAHAGECAPGALLLATSTMLQGGSVGRFSREQVELFCICHLIELNMEVTEEAVRWDVHCPVGDDGAGLSAALQLVHALLTDFKWETAALENSLALHAAQHDARAKSLEQAANVALLESVWSGDARFLDPTPAALGRFQLRELEAAHRRCMATERLELSVVGDFDYPTLDALLLSYIGTLPPSAAAVLADGRAAAPPTAVLPLTCAPPLAERAAAVRRLSICDSEPRAVSYIWGQCATRFGTGGAADARLAGGVGASGAHPLRVSVALELLTELINSRLFSVLRDSLGLVYESCVRFAEHELLPLNGFVVTISAAPAKIDAAHDAALAVLRDLQSGRQPPTTYDLNKARRAVLANYDNHAKENAWWLGRLQHVQAAGLPGKDIRCITEYVRALEALTIDDLRAVCATLGVADGESLSVIMASEPPPTSPAR